MASGIVAVQGRAPSRNVQRSSPVTPMQGLGWIPIALGATAIVAGLGSRKRSTVVLALTACAGVAAIAAIRRTQLNRGTANIWSQAGASGGEPEVERSITIGKTADELRRSWLNPKTLPQIMAGFATVRAIGEGRMHWKIEGPLGRAYEWESETLDNQPEGIGWRSLPNASIANQGSVFFRRAPADRGSVVTLRFRFDPPGGALGDLAVGLLGTTPLELAVDGALRRFKSLIETGEIATTERQPAARADTR